MKRFLRWLFPAYYSEVARCVKCGSIVSKTRMVKDGAYGWFCNEEERNNFCLSNQR
jgi:hypothetical protein